MGEFDLESSKSEELERLIGGSRAIGEDLMMEERVRESEIDPRRFESILRIPVVMQVVIGSVTMPVSNLLKLGRGAVVPLDQKIGEPVDVVVNGRLIARGEVVVVEDDNTRFGVSLTELIEPGSGARRM
ncbi:flagellar motor switch protein FliN [Methylosinus sporium]|uniref:Flagellar motor switch protein FliN n=2 Tax=Methylocystaceae TaxID=31993 RepID=A0A2U1SRT7_METSR|nr:flagellar motor switch protein FliN [Methylosinus sp. KRF6]PWB94326.1 flagellar motor switch protein FliN [Methylosinus sporium]TRL36068.1 flagellar motor switch protein FliN [Methylosinus sporium]